MSRHDEGPRDRTANKENLVSPESKYEVTGNDHGVPYNGTYHNEFHQHLDSSHDSETALKKIRTAGVVSITPELFEKLYLSPQNRVHGDLRTTFGNPTPIALIGFLLSLMPLSMTLMGWRGAGQNGAASIGIYFFFGGMLMVFGSIGEWIIGNTFPFVVFGSFGAFWLGFAATLTPSYNAFGAYSETGVEADGLATTGFRSGFAFVLVSLGIMCLIYLICSIRTNVVFFMIFLTLVLTFALLAGAFLQLNNGNVVLAQRLQVASGACAFCTCIFGWWIFIAIMLASLDFPFEVPVGDLSRYVVGASERKAADKNV